MKFLLTHFNTNLMGDEGCLVCVIDSPKRKQDIPVKTAKLDTQQIIHEEFGKLVKHCSDEHNMQLDFNYGLGLLHNPLDFSKKITVKFPEVISCL